MTLILIAGFGLRASADLPSLESAFGKASKEHQISVLAAPADKCDHPALVEFARLNNLPLMAVDEEIMMTMHTPTQSVVVRKRRQIGSVAEAAALGLFMGPARLICVRQISDDRRAVCAIAEGENM